jgi:hypothetical protein
MKGTTMRGWISIIVLSSACSGTALQPDDGSTQSPMPDLAVADAPATQHCQCAKGSYCDLASNTCKPGCAFDTDCATGHCDVTTHQCFTPGSMCGSATCTPSEQCCLIGGTPTCAASCATDMGSVTVLCQGPSDCPSLSAPLCCAHLVIGPSPGCTYSATVMCQSACAFQFPLGCGTMGQAEVCKAKSDCQDPAAANCCIFMFQGQSGSLCVSDAYKGLAMGGCLN